MPGTSSDSGLFRQGRKHIRVGIVIFTIARFVIDIETATFEATFMMLE